MSKLLRYSLVGAIILMQSMLFEAGADKLAKLRTTKKIVPVTQISAPYFAIQILALKKAPQDPSYFKNIDRAREFDCADGYVRYTVGSYNSAADARQEISQIKSLGYSECFVVDLRSYSLNGSPNTGNSDFRPDANSVYTIQIAALRYPVYVSEFKKFDDVMEFYLSDRIYRYTVGKYRGNEAKDQLSRVKGMGYPQAHLVPYEKYQSHQIE
jgi:hypothetical protein